MIHLITCIYTLHAILLLPAARCEPGLVEFWNKKFNRMIYNNSIFRKIALF